MKKVSEKELKQILLDMLIYIDEVCRENQIEYTLAGGSLLGAIRHQGFIPWDDDADIELARPEYAKLIKVLHEKKSERYPILDFLEVETSRPYVRIYDSRTVNTSKHNIIHSEGVFLDIFPFDILPETFEERQALKKQLQKEEIRLRQANSRGLSYASSSKQWIFFAKSILWFPAHLMSKGKYFERAKHYNELMQQYNVSDSKVTGFALSFYDSAAFPKEMMDEYEDVMFENHTLRKVKNHELYLKMQYNDYMTLPPEDKRRTHSYYDWYWK